MSGAERRHRVPAGRRDTDHGPVIADCRVRAHVRRLGTGCNEKITRAAARDQRRVTGDIINTSQKAITTRSGKHGGRKLLPSILFDILFIIMPLQLAVASSSLLLLAHSQLFSFTAIAALLKLCPPSTLLPLLAVIS